LPPCFAGGIIPAIRTRFLSDHTSQQALEAAKQCRAACVAIRTEAPIGGPAYVAAGRVMDAIDGLAEVFTDDRRHFHLKPHGGTFSG
jgi:hypothetical protein